MTSSELHDNAIMQQCPKFIRCSAPNCPLDNDQEDRDYIKGEPICTLSKNKRLKIGNDTPLPYQGLTKREWSAKKAWEALLEADKAERITRLCFKGHIRSISPGISDPTLKSRGNIPLIKNTGEKQ